MLRWVGDGLVAVTAVMAAEWCWRYHRLTGGAWRRSEMGRHAMAFMAALGLVLALSLARVVAVDVMGQHDPAWFRAMRLVTFVTVPVVIGWRRLILVRFQRAGGDA